MVLQYLYPATVLLYWSGAHAFAVLAGWYVPRDDRQPRRRTLLCLLAFQTATYLAQLVLEGCFASSMSASMPQSQRPLFAILDQNREGMTVSLAACMLVFGLQLATQLDSTSAFGSDVWASWVIASVVEPGLHAASWAARTMNGPLVFRVLDLMLAALRYGVIICALVIYWKARPAASREGLPGDEERRRLLPHDTLQPPMASLSAASGLRTLLVRRYGSQASSPSNSGDDQDRPETFFNRAEHVRRSGLERRLVEEGNWLAYARRLLVRCPACRHIWSQSAD